MEASLTKARQVTPGLVSNLERQAGELLAMKESYLQASHEVVDEVVVPQELTTSMSDLKKRFNAISAELPILTRDVEMNWMLRNNKLIKLESSYRNYQF